MEDQMQRQLNESEKLVRRVKVLSEIVDNFKACRCGLANNFQAGRGTPASDYEEANEPPATPHAIALQRALNSVAMEANRPSLGPASASPVVPCRTSLALHAKPAALGSECEVEARESLLRSSQLLSRLQGAGRSSIAAEMPSGMKALRADSVSPGSEPDEDWTEPQTSPIVLEED
eukprot:scaffold554344_cov42-Prasinocladus_malaysianus.AAC.1